jgi:hypothetical protein
MHLLKNRGYADQETSYSIQRTMTMVINLFDEKLRIFFLHQQKKEFY